MHQPHPSVDLAPHEQQLGKYRLVARLGQGGMGTVYLALASGLGAFRKLLVVKELRHDLPWRESSLSMFMDEAQIAARLDHPNVLQTFEAGEADGRYFLAMEYLDGQPLSCLIDRAHARGGIPLELHVYILCEVLSGLQYAHDLTDYDGTRLHVVHRDVSPQNVFITHHGQVKVVDFGVAKANNGSSVTSPGVFKGKFAYAAPEQLLGRPVDGRCDVFAVGVMLWEAIAGRRFGVPKPSVDAFRTRTQGLEPKIAEVAPHIDPLLAEVCEQALAVDPLQRTGSAGALRAQLQEWLLLQGEHIQSQQLATFMHGLFSEERSARRRIIERAMLDAGASHSVIASLPREPTERESGMAPRVHSHSDPSASTSGISHASRTPVGPSRPQSTRSVRAKHPAGATAASAARPTRIGGAALMVVLALGVFTTTYLLSRRATQPLPLQRSVHSTEPTIPPRPTTTTMGSAVQPATSNLASSPTSEPTRSGAHKPNLPPALGSRSLPPGLEDRANEQPPVPARRRAAQMLLSPKPQTALRAARAAANVPVPGDTPEPSERTSPQAVAPTHPKVTRAKPKQHVRRGSAAQADHAYPAHKMEGHTPPAPRSVVHAEPRSTPPATRSELGMGGDLHQLRRTGTWHGKGSLGIDTEDPYQ